MKVHTYLFSQLLQLVLGLAAKLLDVARARTSTSIWVLVSSTWASKNLRMGLFYFLKKKKQLICISTEDESRDKEWKGGGDFILSPITSYA